MLLKRDVLDGIARGEITVVFRRWKRPTVRAGGTLRTTIGVLAIEGVDEISIEQITAAQAARAGYASRQDLLDDLERREGTTYRITVRPAGEDPRITLRNTEIRDGTEMAEVERRLARMDGASGDGPWTHSYLELIDARPAERAPDLAVSVGMEKKPFKQRVRRLKELGLTESLKIGYRLSPRGRSYLRRVRRRSQG